LSVATSQFGSAVIDGNIVVVAVGVLDTFVVDGVGERVTLGVCDAVLVFVAVLVEVTVRVGDIVEVGVPVLVFVAVPVGAAVFVGVPVLVEVDESPAVTEADGVIDGLGVNDGDADCDAVVEGDCVRVGVNVAVALDDDVAVDVADGANREIGTVCTAAAVNVAPPTGDHAVL